MAGVFAVPPPPDEASYQIEFIKPAACEQALGEAESHARVVCPFPGLEPKWTAANDIRERGPLVSPSELQRGPDGVSDGETDEAAEHSIRGRVIGHSGLVGIYNVPAAQNM
jgi:hypothetical protein